MYEAAVKQTAANSLTEAWQELPALVLCSFLLIVGKGIFMVRCGRTGFDRDQVCPLYRFKSKVQLRPPYTVALTDLGARTPTFSHFSPSPASHNDPILSISFGASCRCKYLPFHVK